MPSMPASAYLRRGDAAGPMRKSEAAGEAGQVVQPTEWGRRVWPYSVPLEMPFRIAFDTVTHARNVLVALDVEGGPAFGESAPFASLTGESQEDVVRDLGGTPDTVAGRCALDTAQWDARARADGVPLCTALTGAPPRGVETSITVPIVEDDEVNALVDRRKAEGFGAFKVKTGLAVEDDLARLASIRDRIGDRELRVDSNQGWSYEDARRALPRLADLDVSFLEQPLAREDLEGHARLRAASEEIGGPPIMLDESVFTAADARAAIDADAADWVNIKLQKSGGLTEGLAIAEVCAEDDVPCMVGCMLESRIAILHGAHLVAAHPNIRKADLDGAFLLAHDPVEGGAGYAEGTIDLGREPGIGVTGVDGAVLG